MMFCLIVLIFSASSEVSFPQIILPDGPLFDWFNIFSGMKELFNNKVYFGFHMNSSMPDISMLINDIVKGLDLTAISNSVILDEPKQDSKSSLSLQAGGCGDKKDNLLTICQMFGLNLDMTNIGISDEHLNIFLANIMAFIPTATFLLAFSVVSLLFYIVQMILSCIYFKPKVATRPNIASIVIFYSSEALVFSSIVLYFVAFRGIENVYNTIDTLDVLVPQIFSSVGSSLEGLIVKGFPEAFGPTFNVFVEVCDKFEEFLITFTDSFIDPAEQIRTSLTSPDLGNPGVFTIFEKKIKPDVDDLYAKLAMLPGTDDIPNYFASQDFSNFRILVDEMLQYLIKFAREVLDYSDFPKKIKNEILPIQDQIVNLGDQKLSKDSDKTVAQMIKGLKTTNMNDVEFLVALSNIQKSIKGFWPIIKLVYYLLGALFLAAIINYGVAFMMRNKYSRFVAHSISICPLLTTIIMLVFGVLFTVLGYADTYFSDNIEISLDHFLDKTVESLLPSRVLKIDPIDMESLSNGIISGTLKISEIRFPKEITMIRDLITSERNLGIAQALNLPNIINISKIGEEIGIFVIQIGEKFSLPQNVLDLLKKFEGKLSSVSDLPSTIDGFFNKGSSMKQTIDTLRIKIAEKNPMAAAYAEPILQRIEKNADEMNKQYKIAMNQISTELSKALGNVDSRLTNFIKEILSDMGYSIGDTMDRIYPMIDKFTIEPVVGPYAIVRNTVFYELSYASSYISISGHLMIMGFVVIVMMMWIRRKGMLTPIIGSDDDDKMSDDDDLNSFTHSDETSKKEDKHSSDEDDIKKKEKENDKINKIDQKRCGSTREAVTDEMKKFQNVDPLDLKNEEECNENKKILDADRNDVPITDVKGNEIELDINSKYINNSE